MSKNPVKDFGPIADDYAFFENHSTEAREDVRAYVEQVRELAFPTGTIRLLDFGCGTGTVTSRFLEQTGWPADRLRLTLVEPVADARRQAITRLAGLTTSPIADYPGLPDKLVESFDCILANHVFYYVSDLQQQLASLIDTLSGDGILITAIAGRTNALIEFWTASFQLLGRDIPYHTSEDVEAALQALGAAYEKREVAYDLQFPDTLENRLHIIRFLLADHLSELPQQFLLDLFDRHTRSGRIEVRTASDHFAIHP